MDEKLPALVHGAPMSSSPSISASDDDDDDDDDDARRDDQRTGSMASTAPRLQGPRTQMDAEKDEKAAAATSRAPSRDSPLHVLGSKAASLSVASLAGKADPYHSPAAGIVALVLISVAIGASCLLLATVLLQKQYMAKVREAHLGEAGGVLTGEERELMDLSDDDDDDAV